MHDLRIIQIFNAVPRNHRAGSIGYLRTARSPRLGETLTRNGSQLRRIPPHSDRSLAVRTGYILPPSRALAYQLAIIIASHSQVRHHLPRGFSPLTLVDSMWYVSDPDKGRLPVQELLGKVGTCQ